MEGKKLIYRWMRSLHRDIGFFVIGLTVIYCISGVMLTYRDTGFLKSETEIEKNIQPGLQAGQLGRALHLKNIEIVGQDEKEIRFTAGTYNRETGTAVYVGEEIPALLRAFNSLHVTPSKNTRSIFTVIYAGLLLFLALSSFWMYKPGSRFFKRGIIITASGLLASILLIVV